MHCTLVHVGRSPEPPGVAQKSLLAMDEDAATCELLLLTMGLEDTEARPVLPGAWRSAAQRSASLWTRWSSSA